MNYIQKKYELLCRITSDINEHLPTLYSYASECESIIELGVRGCVSTWAFTNGLMHNNSSVKRILLNDITPCNINEVLQATKELPLTIEYVWKNDLDIEVSAPVDLTFIDTWHVYGQLKRELAKFSPITKKYIIMHDTTVDGVHGETIRCNWNAVAQSKQTGIPVEEINCGLWKAVEEFLENNPEWKLRERYINNNGLTVLERVA